MDLKILYQLARMSKDYGQFTARLGKYVNIPSTDARCNDIALEDLLKVKKA
jgi:predicted HAD superfamily phosphohydrolase